MRVAIGVIKIGALLILLFFFVCSLDLLSSAFRLVGGRTTGIPHAVWMGCDVWLPHSFDYDWLLFITQQLLRLFLIVHFTTSQEKFFNRAICCKIPSSESWLAYWPPSWYRVRPLLRPLLSVWCRPIVSIINWLYRSAIPRTLTESSSQSSLGFFFRSSHGASGHSNCYGRQHRYIGNKYHCFIDPNGRS